MENKMKDFELNLDISLENNVLFLADECSSGEEYGVNNRDEILEHIKNYVIDYLDYLDCFE